MSTARVSRGRDVVWVNGRLLPASRATLPIYDRGFLYGDAVFETVRAYDGRLFLWPQHQRRLTASLRAFRIPVPRADLAEAARRVIDARGLADAAIRITVTRGTGEGLVAPPGLVPNVVVMARPIPADLPEQREQGVGVLLLPFGRGHGGITDGHKTNAYLSAVLGKTRAAERRAFEGLYVERDGMVSEGTTSNVFAVRRGRLLTPPLEAGCLPGVTRQVILHLAAEDGIPYETMALQATTLHELDEVFLTASTLEVMPVVRVDRQRVATGKPGTITRLLQDRYASFVRRTLARRRT
ncbi:aminotransferase class IV [Candidatus Binatia bacterium]|jgi:D-amino acid aminotransferase|nr:aminotransferase class IV [Candidatus Binatia bacterium]